MVTIIFCGDLKYCPYIQRYIERLEAKKMDYNVLFWNRSAEKLDLSSNYIYLECKSDLSKSKFYKLIDFIRYMKWVIAYFEKNKPQKCILLSSLTGFLFGNYLIKKRIPYIFDIRDYSYEYIPFYYDREKKVIENSFFTAISSKGFLNFLPQGNNYVTAHNFNRKDIVLGKKIVRSNKIRFVWNGVMRYFDYQKQIILALANDNRYEILYYGDGPDLGLYRNFCSENSVHNVYFLGKYENSFKRQILSNTDFINNCYGYIKNAGNKLKYAVSNRFYDGIVYHIPQLVESSGYKTDLVLKNNLGIAYTIKDNLADFLYKYYECIDENKFDKNCNDVLEKVLEEDNKFIERIDDFISP